MHAVSSKICVYGYTLCVHLRLCIYSTAVCVCMCVCVCVFVRRGAELLLSLSDNCVQNVKQTVAGTKPQGHSAICCCSSCICMCVCNCAYKCTILYFSCVRAQKESTLACVCASKDVNL